MIAAAHPKWGERPLLVAVLVFYAALIGAKGVAFVASGEPVAMLLGTNGWGIFVATPWVQVDMQDARRGYFIAGKFDQLQRDIPYGPIIQAFRGLIYQLVALGAIALQMGSPGRAALNERQLVALALQPLRRASEVSDRRDFEQVRKVADWRKLRLAEQLHGHTALVRRGIDDRMATHGGTTFYNCTGSTLVELMPPDTAVDCHVP